MSEMEKIMIEDTEYFYDPEREYIKDGHAYCKNCHERKDGKALEMLGKKRIYKVSCKCDRDREAKQKAREKQMEIERLKRSCFASLIQWTYTFENYQGEENQSLTIAKNFVKEYEEMKEKLDRYENQNASFMAQYQSLVGINNALSTGDLMKAAELYTALDQAAITEESLISMLSSIKSQMEGSVYLRLQELGSTAWNVGRQEEALQYYTWSVKIRREAENLFLLARLQQTMGNTTEANQNFDAVVGEFPGSTYAERARQARGY